MGYEKAVIIIEAGRVVCAGSQTVYRNVARGVVVWLRWRPGGGIYTTGTLELTDCTLTRNLAVSGGRFANGASLGGGIYANIMRPTPR